VEEVAADFRNPQFRCGGIVSSYADLFFSFFFFLPTFIYISQGNRCLFLGFFRSLNQTNNFNKDRQLDSFFHLIPGKSELIVSEVIFYFDRPIAFGDLSTMSLLIFRCVLN
jgi:hypothetical protein